MTRFLSNVSHKVISDWGLASLLRAAANTDSSKHNVQILLHHLSENLLDNADPGKGDQIELVFKQAGLSPAEFEILTLLWGKPAKSIFCFRTPDEFIRSALIKFPNVPLRKLQAGYETQLDRFKKIGGDLFEYNSNLLIDDYKIFLAPLSITNPSEPFRYTGNPSPEHVTPLMWEVYKTLKVK